MKIQTIKGKIWVKILDDGVLPNGSIVLYNGLIIWRVIMVVSKHTVK